MLDRVYWCRRCGCVRLFREKHWRVPLDRAGELVLPAREPEEPTTVPDTPVAKKKDD